MALATPRTKRRLPRQRARRHVLPNPPVEARRELERLKSAFLSSVSHELRTPLSLIYGYSELLVDRAPGLSAEEVAEMASQVHASACTMARLVDELLDFARLEHGRVRIERRTTSISGLLAGLVERFRSQPGGQRIVLEVAPTLEAEVDPDRIAQAVGNLLMNALQYAPDGPIAVRAARRAESLWIEVEDHGVGIPPEEIGRIWESFFRGGPSLALPNRGNGLGLTVVKQLVELHGGQVGVSSAPGQGATFWLSLPAEAA